VARHIFGKNRCEGAGFGVNYRAILAMLRGSIEVVVCSGVEVHYEGKF
jgi:hypothetical protein